MTAPMKVNELATVAFATSPVAGTMRAATAEMAIVTEPTMLLLAVPPPGKCRRGTAIPLVECSQSESAESGLSTLSPLSTLSRLSTLSPAATGQILTAFRRSCLPAYQERCSRLARPLEALLPGYGVRNP